MITRKKINNSNELDLVINLVNDDRFCDEIIPVLNLSFLENEYARIIVSWIIDYYKQYKCSPKKDILKIYKSNILSIQDDFLKENILSYIENCNNASISNNTEYQIDRCVKYLKKKSFEKLIADMNAAILSDDVDNAEKEFIKYKKIEKNSGESVSLLDDYEKIINAYNFEQEKLFSLPGAYGKVAGDFYREDFVGILAPMKAGKCLGKGTEVLMVDGSVKKVEDIVAGDKLMGVDSTARNVLSTNIGYAEIFRVTSNVNVLCKDKKPDIDFTCNGDHILVLKNVWECEKSKIKEFRKDGLRNGELTKHGKNNLLKQEEIEISVYDYLKLSDYQKQRLKLFRVKCNYAEKLHKISPYIIGVWLGDGTSCRADITTADLEIIERCKSECLVTHDELGVSEDKRNGIKTITFKRGENEHSVMLTELKNLNLLNNKHIPNEYLIDSEENRLNLLAGIIDTDGYVSKNCIEISLMNEKLANDVKTLCQQLGFRTTFSERNKKYKGMYADTNGWKKSWCIKITGKLSKIPCLLQRKKAKDSKKYSSLNNTFSFSVKSIGKDNYYGFTLDGDHKFLLADTTVSHNTWMLIDIAIEALKNGLKVVFFSLEMNMNAMIRRCWSCLSGQFLTDINIDNYPYFDETEDGKFILKFKNLHKKASSTMDIQKKQKQLKRLFRGGNLQIFCYPTNSLSVDNLSLKLDELEQNNFVPDVVIVDYADIMLASDRNSSYRDQIDGIWKKLRGLAQERKIAIFTASQTTRGAINREVEVEDTAEDIRKIAHVTSMISLSKTKTYKKNNILVLSQLAVREGRSELRKVVCTQCLDIGRPVLDSRFKDEVIFKFTDENLEKNVKRLK